jgi:hypothetical protein
LSQHGPDHIETATDPAAFADWPNGLYEEMLANIQNGTVGSVLVSETDRVRVWHLSLKPGCRCPFHRHVNPYFWSCHTNGTSRSYFSDGRIKDTDHFAGETRHFHYGPGDYMVHSLENVGETELVFTTVEFLDGLNAPLAIPDDVRLGASAVAAE